MSALRSAGMRLRNPDDFCSVFFEHDQTFKKTGGLTLSTRPSVLCYRLVFTPVVRSGPLQCQDRGLSARVRKFSGKHFEAKAETAIQLAPLKRHYMPN